MGCRSSKTTPIDLYDVHAAMEPDATRQPSMSVFTNRRHSATVIGKKADLPQVREISYSRSLSATFQGSSEQSR